MGYQHIDVQPVAGALGAEIFGVDLGLSGAPSYFLSGPGYDAGPAQGVRAAFWRIEYPSAIFAVGRPPGNSANPKGT